MTRKDIEKKRSNKLLNKIKTRMGVDKIPIKLGEEETGKGKKDISVELTHLPSEYAVEGAYVFMQMISGMDVSKAKEGKIDENAGQKVLGALGKEELNVIRKMYVVSLGISYPEWSEDDCNDVVGRYFIEFLIQGMELFVPNMSASAGMDKLSKAEKLADEFRADQKLAKEFKERSKEES